MGKREPKFDKRKCLKCIYHGNNGSGWHVVTGDGEAVNIICNYAAITGETCMKRAARDELKDSRGDDYNNCKLFVEGKAIGARVKGVIF